VAGEKAGKRIALSFVGLDEIEGKVADMAGDLTGANGDRLSAILAGEPDVWRLLNVRKTERFPCCVYVIDVLYDPRNMVHRLVALRQFGGRTGHCTAESNDKAPQQFHSTLHSGTFAQSVNGCVLELLEWRAHPFVPAFSTLPPSGVMITWRGG